MKNSTKKKIISFTLCSSIVGAAFIQPIVAIQPSYSVGKYYKESKYYERLLEVEATGDQRYDVIAVAISQLGYHEGNSDSQMHGANSSGTRNFVEYNHIIGGPVDNGEGNGVSYGFEWCAAFASWCLRQAGVSESQAVTEISCIRMVEWLRENSLYKSRSSGYAPKTADLVFFRASSSSSRASHVGLVVGSDSTYIYTVEGNNGDRVNYHRYKKTDSLILGYGAPNYKTLDSVEYDFELKEGYIEPGIYVTTDDLNIRTGRDTSYTSLGKIPKGTELEITEAIGDWARVSYNGKSGWSSIDYLEYAEGIVYSIAYDGNGAVSVPGRQKKEYGKAITISGIIPEKEACVFLGWSADKSATSADYKPGDRYADNKSVKLYAVWQYVGYTVNFYGDDGSLIESQKYDLGDEIIPPKAPEKKGDLLYRYVFSGWSPSLPEGVEGDASFRATYEKRLIFEAVEKNEDSEETTAVPTDPPHDEESRPTDDTEDLPEESTDGLEGEVTEGETGGEEVTEGELTGGGSTEKEETTDEAKKNSRAGINLASIFAGVMALASATAAVIFIKKKN